jgi:hypothetical protein
MNTPAFNGKTAAALALLCLGLSGPVALWTQAAKPASGAKPANPAVPAGATGSTNAGVSASVGPLLARHYQEGEKVAYTISCINQSSSATTEYEASAAAVVRKDPAGIFVEDLAWTDLHLNDEQVRLSAASLAVREPLSLAPSAKLAVPDLSKVQVGLIGPITDLLTFYADVKIAMNQKGLMRAGDHAYFKYGTPNSWADGTHVVLGQDAIDFDITLEAVDPAAQVATLMVRHVPPAQPQIKVPAPWMTERVGMAQNNWVQVEKGADGKYIAGVGQETFDVQIRVALGTGRILSAVMDNPVDVLERTCTDAALTACGPPERYRIHRHITLHSELPLAMNAPR